jgi:hypothetical protein
MFQCTFELNGEPLSKFVAGTASYPAFSGLKPHINSRSAACFPDAGPIPPRQYYIFDRQSGGRLGALRDTFGGRDDWFALHTIDDKIDDETLCDQIKRGAFRLHPKGMYGISKGCIVIERKADFDHLRAHLKSMKPQPVKGSGLLAYGRVVVK